MLVNVTKLPNSTLQVKGVLPTEEFNAYITKATKAFTDEVELPGFRKGKAPEKLVLEKVGEGKILEEAARMALNEFYPTLLKEHAPQAIGRPQIKITKLARGNPFEWEAEIATLPDISLPNYTAIAKEKNAAPEEEAVVSEKEVADSLEWLQKSRKKGEGEAAVLPELNDDFAKSVGAFENLDALKKLLEENIRLEKQDKAQGKRKMDILEAIAEKTSIAIPPQLIESEKEKMMHELERSITSMGMSWADYLGHIKKTEEDLKKEWTSDAEKRVKLGLVLREIAKQEKLEPTEEDLDAWAQKYLASQDEATRKNVDLESLKE